MRLLARYLLRECLVAFGYCFSAFLVLWVALDLIAQLENLQEKKLKFFEVVQLYLLKVPEFLPIAMPVALLLALLYALTNHARYNEITAIRAAGISLWRLSLPYFAVGLGSAALLFVTNEFLAPQTAEMADQVSRERTAEEQQSVKNLFFHNSSAGRHWHINVYNLRTGEMLGPWVEWKLPDGTIRSLKADRAAYSNNVWTFYQLREIRQPPTANALQIKLPETNIMAFPEFSETPEIIRSEVKVSDRFGRQGKSSTHRADIPILEIQNYLRLHPNPEKSIRSWLYTKLHGRLAAPVTCVVVVVLAVPFATASGRRNVFVGVAASITIFFLYYLLQQLGFAFAEAGRVPAWVGAWFPNLLFGFTGLWLMMRAR
jgi:lipopolysaccharide export system permease protein